MILIGVFPGSYLAMKAVAGSGGEGYVIIYSQVLRV